MSFEEVTGKGLQARVYGDMEEGEHVYYTDISPDKEYIAAVFGNGNLKIMDPRTLETYGSASPGKPYDDLPCTCVKWFPSITEEDKKKQYRLISVSSAGGVFGWNWDGMSLTRFKKLEEKDNEISVVDFCPTGDFFITAGKDRLVRLYDTKTFKIVQEMKKGIDENGIPRPTHISRIFSARFLTKTLAASAGWESPAQLWDLRTYRSDRQILGTQGSTDCVEPIPESNMFILTAQKGDSKLQLIDAIRGEEVEDATTRLNSHLSSQDNLYISRFSPSSRHVWSACGTPNKLLVISFSTGDIVGSLDLPSAPLNLLVVETDAIRAYVSCQSGNLVVATIS